MTTSPTTPLDSLRDRATEHDIFDSVAVVNDGTRLDCLARGPESDAFYRVDRTDDGWSISLVTDDRWLSESIEAELVHSGDSIEELLEEELIDLGLTPTEIPMKHYRSEDMLYTFITRLPSDTELDVVLTWLLGYEKTFAALGDMTPDEED